MANKSQNYDFINIICQSIIDNSCSHPDNGHTNIMNSNIITLTSAVVLRTEILQSACPEQYQDIADRTRALCQSTLLLLHGLTRTSPVEHLEQGYVCLENAEQTIQALLKHYEALCNHLFFPSASSTRPLSFFLEDGLRLTSLPQCDGISAQNWSEMKCWLEVMAHDHKFISLRRDAIESWLPL